MMQKKVPKLSKVKRLRSVQTSYEIVVIYDKDCGEVITFCTDVFMNGSNDIVSYAVEQGFLEEVDRDKVRVAMAISDFEFEYINKK